MGDDDDGCIAGGAQSDLEGQDEMSDLNNLLEEINIDQKATNITSNSIKSEDDDNARVLSKKDIRSEWQKSFSWDEEVTVANQQIFGNEDFRENQREIINCTKSKKDVLALIPTGGGKSLTF